MTEFVDDDEDDLTLKFQPEIPDWVREQQHKADLAMVKFRCVELASDFLRHRLEYQSDNADINGSSLIRLSAGIYRWVTNDKDD